MIYSWERSRIHDVPRLNRQLLSILWQCHVGMAHAAGGISFPILACVYVYKQRLFITWK